jgi:hypothetical protein
MRSAKPLIRRTADGRRYVDPSELPPPRPRYSSGLPTQPASEAVTGPEPTPARAPKPKPNRRSQAPAIGDETVLEIQADHATGKWTQADLAYIYNVSQHSVCLIVNGRGRYRDIKPVNTQPCVAPQED